MTKIGYISTARLPLNSLGEIYVERTYLLTSLPSLSQF